MDARAVAKLNRIQHELLINGDGVGLGTIKLDAAGINTSFYRIYYLSPI